MIRHPKILLITNIYSHHIYRFVSSLKKTNPSLHIDIFNVNYKKNDFPHPNLYDIIFSPKQHFPSLFYKIPKIRAVIAYVDTIISFRSVKDCHYDIVNIINLTPFSFFIRKRLNKISNKVMITPFGSDILRMNKIKFQLYKKVFKIVDNVSVMPTPVRDMIINKFNYPMSKIVELGFGSDMIDMIVNNTKIDKEKAKKNLGIEGCYTIVCGYNGYKTQNHLKIIEAINSIKTHFANNLVLVIPMNYGAPSGYIENVKEELKNKEINYLIFEEFLSEEELLNIRLCADMFIHAQPTDNLSGSICEYILSGAKMINGEWIRYPLLETYGVPYYLFDTFDNLGNVVLKVYKGEEFIEVNPETIKFIKQLSRTNMIKGWLDFYLSCVDS